MRRAMAALARVGVFETHPPLKSKLNRESPRMEKTMQPVKDASHIYEVERRARHAERPGFRIS